MAGKNAKAPQKAKVVKDGDNYFVTLPKSMVNGRDAVDIYWTEAGGVLQLSSGKPIVTIPIMTEDLRNQFESQNG